MTRVYEGPVQVIAKDALMDADAVLVDFDGWWGGFLRMRSVAGAELVQNAALHRHVTIDGETSAKISTQRTALDSPVLRVQGLGVAPFSARDIRRVRSKQ